MREDMKLVIADTFSKMLEKEDIDKITVTKLIGECHISRQTFYYHFRDIMDVLDWMWGNLIWMKRNWSFRWRKLSQERCSREIRHECGI